MYSGKTYKKYRLCVVSWIIMTFVFSSVFVDEKKLDEVYLETEKSRQMLSQILLRTINTQNYDQRLQGTDPQVKTKSLLSF